MEHNKYNLQIGDMVFVDEQYSRCSIVRIKGFTNLTNLYASVYTNDIDKSWVVMTNRLTPIKYDNTTM